MMCKKTILQILQKLKLKTVAILWERRKQFQGIPHIEDW